jgi:hypothetical protein
MLPFVVILRGSVNVRDLNKKTWTQRSQSANIYPNLIALSTLVEKKDAKVRVDIN